VGVSLKTAHYSVRVVSVSIRTSTLF